MGKLLDMFVSFSPTGQEAVKAAMDDIASKSAKLSAAIGNVGKKITEDFVGASGGLKAAAAMASDLAAKMRTLADSQTFWAKLIAGTDIFKERLDRITATVAKMRQEWLSAFGAITATITGFATAGVNASSMGDQLSAQFQRLSLAIAGSFAPEIQALINGIRDLADWIANLSDKVKQKIAYWTVMGAGFLAFTVIVPRIVAGVMLIVNAIRALVVQMTVMQALSGPAGWGKLIGGVAMAAAAIAGLYKLHEFADGLTSPGKDKPGRGMAAPKVGGPEDIGAAFSRMNVAALNATAGAIGKSTEEKALDELTAIREATQQTRDGVANIRLPTTR